MGVFPFSLLSELFHDARREVGTPVLRERLTNDREFLRAVAGALCQNPLNTLDDIGLHLCLLSVQPLPLLLSVIRKVA